MYQSYDIRPRVGPMMCRRNRGQRNTRCANAAIPGAPGQQRGLHYSPILGEDPNEKVFGSCDAVVDQLAQFCP